MIFKTIIVFLLGVLFMLICVLGIRDGTPPTFSTQRNNNNGGIDVITRPNENNHSVIFHDRFLHFVTQLKQDKIPFHILTHTTTDLWLTFTPNLHDYLQVKYKYLPIYTTSHCFYLYDNAYVHLPKKIDTNDTKVENKNNQSTMCVTLFGMSEWRESFLHHFNVKTYSFHTLPLNVNHYNIHPGIVMINRHSQLTDEDIRSLWHKDSRYILYNFQDVSLFPNMTSQYVLMQPLKTSNFTQNMQSLNNNNNNNNNNNSYFYDQEKNLLLLPPASHLTPYEINKNANALTKKLLQHQADTNVVFICVKESPQHIHDKLLALEQLLALEHNLNVQIVPNPSREKQQEYIQQSAMCVVIQPDEEVLDQYISPDIVTNLSYGRIVLTNNIHAQNISSNKFIVAKTNLHELIQEGLQLQKKVSVDEFKLFMPFIPTLTQHIDQLVKHNYIDI